MSLIEEEVRQALNAQSQRVAPAVALPTEVAARVETIERQRRSGRIASASVVLLVLAVTLPLLLTVSDHDTSAVTARARTVHTHHTTASGTSGTAVGALPANYLNWQPRGQRPPVQLFAFVATSSTPRPRVAMLWAGKLAGVGWVAVVQTWTNGSTKATIGAVVADAAGNSPHWVSQGTLYFTHGDVGDAAPAATAGMQMIRVVTVALGGGKVLALGAPDVSTIWYAADGVHFAPNPTSDGVAVITRAPRVVHGTSVDLVQARNAAGATVTPADAVAARDAALLRLPAPSAGWALPDIT